jgi:hypothetical protein
VLTAGFHDVFGLYGRPDKYRWDTQDPSSLFFAYPTGMERGVSTSNNCLSRPRSLGRMAPEPR